MSNSLQPLLPWIGVLLLLAFKANRCGQAWWIWAPLGGLAGVSGLLPFIQSSAPSSMFGIFNDAFGVLSFSLAAVWLLSTYVGSAHRFGTFLELLLVFCGFSLFSLVSQLQGGLDTETMQTGVMVGATSLAIALALSLAGVLCRRRYRPATLARWLVFLLFGTWLVVLSALFIPSALSGGRFEIWPLVTAVLSMTGLALSVVLPFLILSFTNAFYRERLVNLLHLAPQGPLATGCLPKL